MRSKLTLAAALFVLVVAAGGPPLRADVVGVPKEGPAAAQVSTSALMERAARFIGPRHPKDFEAKEFELPDRSGIPSAPGAPETSSWPPPAPGQAARPVRPLAAQTVGLQFDGATLRGPGGVGFDTGAFPPDTMGAAGPSQFIVFVNGRLRSFAKATGTADGVLNIDPDDFFVSVRSASTSDPRIRYDRISQRWFLVIIDVAFPNRILLAVSDAASAGVVSGSTVWSFFFVANSRDPDGGGPNACLMDYPTLGVDANALYVGGNQFCGATLGTANYDSTSAYVIRKTSVLGAGPIVSTAFHGLAPGSSAGILTPQGVDNPDASSTEGYFIGVDNAAFSLLVVKRVSTPGGTPTLSADLNVTVPTTRFAASVPHSGNTGGSTGRLDALDDRLFAASMRNGRLWTAHNIGVNTSGVGTSGGRAAVRWYELQNLSTTPALVQSGTVFDSAATNPASFWIPSIMVSGQGHAAMGFSTAGNLLFASAARSGRLAGDALGTQDASSTYMAGVSAYNPGEDSGASAGARRWGDYSYTSVDPNDDMTMWTIQEYANGNNGYAVRVAKLLAPPPATPSLAAPASACAGVASTLVTVTGTSSGGSGFFDPGAGFANRLSAAVDGGVTVNSATYVSPTSVSLDLSTVGATTGARTVTITNPDGQALGAAIFTVNAAPSLPVITGPSVAGPASPNRVASVPTNAGSTYAWTITNGTITSATNQPTVTFTTGSTGTTQLQLVETSAGGCPSPTATKNVTIQPFGAATLFYPVTPCRVLDTRNPDGTYGGPILGAGPGATRTFPLAGVCGVPASAKALSTNVTIAQAAAAGELRAYAATLGTPDTTVISFRLGATRANNALLGLPSDLSGNVVFRNESAGSVHLIVDVNGYWE